METNEEEKPEMLISLGDIFGGSKQTENNCDNEVESNEDTETQEVDIRIGSEDVIQEDDNYLSIQQYLKKELSTVEDGSAEYIDIEELENTLDATIRKHED